MKIRRFAAASAAALAVACGGKSDAPAGGRVIAYTGPTTPVSISTPDAVRSTVAATLGSADGMAGTLDSLSVTVTPGAAAGSIPTPTPAELGALAARHLRAAAGAFLPGAAISGGGPCEVSGSAAIQGDLRDVSRPGTWTGDWGQLTFTNCVDAPGAAAMTGAMRFDIVEGNGVGFLDGEPAAMTPGFTYRARLTVMNLALVGAGGAWAGIDGEVTLSTVKRATPAEVEEVTSGPSMVVVGGRGTETLSGMTLSPRAGQERYSIVHVAEYANGFYSAATADRAAIDARLCGTELRGCVEVVTEPPFRGLPTADHPSTGSMTISSGNARIDVTAVSDVDADVTYDLDVTTPPPPTTVHATWACLDAGSCAF